MVGRLLYQKGIWVAGVSRCEFGVCRGNIRTRECIWPFGAQRGDALAIPSRQREEYGHFKQGRLGLYLKGRGGDRGSHLTVLMDRNFTTYVSKMEQ